jgi:lipopolysaccharide biosynthesis glycosyltransferase
MEKNIIFIPNINAGDNRSQPYHLSIASWKAWAAQYPDVHVVEWTEPIMEVSQMKTTLQRYWVFDILEHNGVEYDQVLLVDADTIIHPDCPNFFLETDHEFCGVLNNGCYEWTTRSIRDWGKALFPTAEPVKTWRYLNGGFLIANKKHKDFFKKIQNFYLENLTNINALTAQIKAGTDQTIVNYLLQEADMVVKILPECYNLQSLFDKHLLHLPGQSWWPDDLIYLDAGWIYHFNAIPNNPRDDYYWMERTYNALYKTNKI